MAVNFIVARTPILVSGLRRLENWNKITKNRDGTGNKQVSAWGRHRRFYRSIYRGRRISADPWQYSLVGQSFSALGASSLQDVSAVSGSHSLSEAMLLFSLTLFRLISSQHMKLHLLN